MTLRRPRSERRFATWPDSNTLALAAQVGRSVASLAIGYLVLRVGEPALEGGSTAPDAIAAGLAIVVAVMLHVVVGEQVPKLLAIGDASGWVARLTLGPLRVLAVLLRPLLWLLDGMSRALVRAFGVSPAGMLPLVHTSAEIRLLVAQSSEQGVVEEDEREMIHGVFAFSDTVAREVMTPRTDMVAVPVEIGLSELVEVVGREGHSRVPVYEGTIDTVVGVILAKDLLPLLRDRLAGAPVHVGIREIMREPYFVPDTKPVDDLLAEFRQHSVHLAIVLDEFGGTYGLVTMEDLLEEIVGEINDEYDVDEPDFAPTPEGDVLIDGGASISEVNERCGTALPEADFDTVGGYIFGALGRVPVRGDIVQVPGSDGEMELRVEETEERRVLAVRLTRASAVAGPASPEV